VKNDCDIYAEKILSGKIKGGHFAKKMVERYISDLARQGDKKFPYRFDLERAVRPVNFIETMCYHVRGEWASRREKVHLELWQKFIIMNIFGWICEDGYRRFVDAYIKIARKNGKSFFAAAIGLYMFIADGEHGAEIYSVATKRDQANEVFHVAKQMVDVNNNFAGFVTSFRNNLHITKTFSKYESLSSDYDSMDGKGIHYASIDEYHAHKTKDLYRVIRSSSGSRRQPLFFVITTAGNNLSAPCFEDESYFKRILDGYNHNESQFCAIYDMDKGDDWRDKKNWIKANPNLGVSVFQKDLDTQYRKASDVLTDQNEFKTKRLNIWLNNRSAWMSSDIWNRNIGKFDLSEYDGHDCVCSFDLSMTTDITAVTYLFKDIEKEKYIFHHNFYIPGSNIIEKERCDKVPYRTWEKEGFVNIINGEIIDYTVVCADIIKNAKRFKIKEIVYDPYNAGQVTNTLEDAGIQCIAVKQGMGNISPAAKEFHTQAVAGRMVHDNRCMDWMIGCTDIYQDTMGNIRPLKPKYNQTGKRIDGVITSIMALSRFLVREQAEAKPTISFF